MTSMVAPTGSRIVATLETIRAEALLNDITCDENGVVTLRYAGQTNFDWEGQTTVRRPPAGSVTPERVYIDQEGREWLESQLVASPEPHGLTPAAVSQFH